MNGLLAAFLQLPHEVIPEGQENESFIVRGCRCAYLFTILIWLESLIALINNEYEKYP
jgi:hypothetical protein